MQIVCPSCTKRLQIADDKLPADRQVRLSCPACQERFTFDPQANHPADATAAHGPAMPPEPPAAAPRAVYPPAAAPAGFDIADIGPAPRALVCLDHVSHREALQEALTALGYHTVHTPAHQFQALAHLSQVPYDCCILDALFDGGTLEANPVLACVAEIPMERRRYMFVALCAPQQTTADNMLAYSCSVNLLLNYTEIPACHRILEQHMTEHKRLYKVYRELRQQLGKDI
jgi:predicted Zn finger-like uncharacterized protein